MLLEEAERLALETVKGSCRLWFGLAQTALELQGKAIDLTLRPVERPSNQAMTKVDRLSRDNLMRLGALVDSYAGRPRQAK